MSLAAATLAPDSPPTRARAATGPHPDRAPSSRRDAAVDVARAWCLTVVVALHALMVGVSVAADGPLLQNAMEHWSGFGILTWFGQVMPLFFVLGGFSGFLQWERARLRGDGYGAQLAGRLRRLFVPAVAAVFAIVVVLALLQLTGLPEEIVATAGFRLSQPLWFLGVYVVCTAALPLLAALHRRRPLLALAGLGAAVLSVDVVRASTGVAAVGLINLLFVWLLVQQLGFVLATLPRDGWSARRARWMAVAAFGTLAVLCAAGVYSPDLYLNLNPPTGALVLLGVGQLAVFSLLRTRLARLAEGRILGRYVAAMNRRAMTVYSWHMLVLVLLAGVLLVTGGESLPQPLSAEWWLTRPLWLAAAGVAVAVVAAVAGRLEARRSDAGAGTGWRVARPVRAVCAAAAGAGGVLLILVSGSALAGWVVGALLILTCLGLLRSPGVSAEQRSAVLTGVARVGEA